MSGRPMSILGLVITMSMSVQPVQANRLDLTILPPDLPPVDICNAPPETREQEELQEDLGEETKKQINEDRVRLLRSDIRRYMREDAVGHFDFLQELIAWRAQIDPDFAGIEEIFARIELFIAADRLQLIRERGVLPALLAQSAELTNNQRVELAQYYIAGLAGEDQKATGLDLLTDAALDGNANALMDVLRLQLANATPENWDLLPEDTAALAFGGLVGQFNRGLCDRAERIAREYTSGDVLQPNPDLAFAWRKFAADMGGAEASWRVVEHQLAAPAHRQNDEMLLHYLRKAVQNGFSVLPADVTNLRDSGARTEPEIRAILGRNYVRVGHAKRRSAVPHLVLDMTPIPDAIDSDSPLLQYLYKAVLLPDAPADISARLADEILLRKGMWTGAAEAKPYLTRAAQAGHADAMLQLSELLIRHRDDTDALREAERWLHRAVATQAGAPAMKQLDRFYRCQHPDAPNLRAAMTWSRARAIVDRDPLNISPDDLARLDPLRDPEAVARLQSDAMRGHGNSRGYFLQYLQSDIKTSDTALSFWAQQVSSSDRAIEDFAVSEYELALTAVERSAAIELLGRVYLHIRAPIALELAVALIEHEGRDPTVAREIEKLLSFGAQRAEGASLRLMQRLKGGRDAAIYQKHAAVIDERGDFLAHMVAAPFVPEEKFEDYMARAISVMNCTTKDVNEIADAYIRRGKDAEAAHWLRIGLVMENGNVLSRLGLSPRQMNEFDSGAPPRPTPSVMSGNDLQVDALHKTYLATSDAAATGFAPDIAARSLVGLIQSSRRVLALQLYRHAHWDIRRRVDESIDVVPLLRDAAEGGASLSQFELALQLRANATSPEDLAEAADWMEAAALGGNTDAMIELAQALAVGLGRDIDRRLAVIWLEKARSLGHRDAQGWITALTAAGLE